MVYSLEGFPPLQISYELVDLIKAYKITVGVFEFQLETVMDSIDVRNSKIMTIIENEEFEDLLRLEEREEKRRQRIFYARQEIADLRANLKHFDSVMKSLGAVFLTMIAVSVPLIINKNQIKLNQFLCGLNNFVSRE
jgi:hypothetical protein